MAFGPVLGSNFINLSLILLADAVFGGPVINELSRFETVSDRLGVNRHRKSTLREGGVVP